jgi:diketogulonate reductase-like aldo/keto reductase
VNLFLAESQPENRTSQLVHAWALAQGDGIIPASVTANRVYPKENVAARELQLTVPELARQTEGMRKGAAAGKRYAAARIIVFNR